MSQRRHTRAIRLLGESARKTHNIFHEVIFVSRKKKKFEKGLLCFQISFAYI